ncbi:MAG: hypothetical protein HQL54_10695 [Magnetococcales bacterium]|nr:hypothetical protein [Magnetococcales bacterium]
MRSSIQQMIYGETGKDNASGYQVLMAYLFFIPFCMPIVNPMFFNKVIYLYALIPLIDLVFIRNTIRHTGLLDWAVLSLILIAGLLSMDAIAMAKLIVLIMAIAYMSYLWQRGLFYIFYWIILLTVIVSIIQYAAAIVGPEWAKLVGPRKIYSLIWGMELRGNTNFYATNFTGGFLMRVSGMSLEAGFYSALISTSIMMYLLDHRVVRTRLVMGLLILGYLLSLSKIGFSLLLVMLIFPFRRIVNRIPAPIALISAIGLMFLVIGAVYDVLPEIAHLPTFAHRTLGYVLLWDLSTEAFFLGADPQALVDLVRTLISGFVADFLEGQRNLFTGIPLIIAENGIIFAFALLMALIVKGSDAVRAVFYLLVTFSVNPMTSDSFVIAATFLLISTGFSEQHAPSAKAHVVQSVQRPPKGAIAQVPI